MNMGIPKYIFDLDKTLWNCYNASGEEVWAKQLSPPFVFKSDNVLCDASGSCVKLHNGFREYIKRLAELADMPSIGFLSVGALQDIPLEEQPSVAILQKFELYSYFNAERILVFKTEKKDKYLKDMGYCVFIDDDDKHLADARKLSNVTVIDRKSFKDWTRGPLL